MYSLPGNGSPKALAESHNCWYWSLGCSEGIYIGKESKHGL